MKERSQWRDYQLHLVVIDYIIIIAMESVKMNEMID